MKTEIPWDDGGGLKKMACPSCFKKCLWLVPLWAGRTIDAWGNISPPRHFTFECRACKHRMGVYTPEQETAQ